MRRIAVAALGLALFCAGCCCWLCNHPSDSHAVGASAASAPALTPAELAQKKTKELTRAARDRNDYAAAALANDRFVAEWSPQSGQSEQAMVAAATREAARCRALERSWQQAQAGSASDVRAFAKLMRDPGGTATDPASAAEQVGALRLLQAKDPQVQAWYSANFPGRLEPQLGARGLAYEPSVVAIGLERATQERGLGLTSGATRGARLRYVVEIEDGGPIMQTEMHSFGISISGELVAASGAVVGKIAVHRQSPGLSVETALRQVIEPLSASAAAEVQMLVQDAALAGGDKLL